MKSEKVSIIVSEAERQRFLKTVESAGLDESSALSVAVKEWTQKHRKACPEPIEVNRVLSRI